MEAKHANARGDGVRRFEIWTLYTLLVLSVAANVVLVTRLRAAPAMPPSSDVLAFGTRVPPLEAEDVSHGQSKVAFGDDRRDVVLYVFSPTCGWCLRNHPLIDRVASSARDRFRFVGVALSQDGLTSFLASHPLPFPVVVEPSAASRAAYHLGPTPTTIVVSPAGTVRRAWSGAYLGRNAAEVEEFFGVRLPAETSADSRRP